MAYVAPNLGEMIRFDLSVIFTWVVITSQYQEGDHVGMT